MQNEEKTVRRPWSANEVIYLKQNYDLMGTRAVAEALGRRPAAVRQMAWRIGVRLTMPTIAPAELVEAWARRTPLVDVWQLTGCSRAGLYRQARALGLPARVHSIPLARWERPEVQEQVRRSMLCLPDDVQQAVSELSKAAELARQ